MEPVICALDGCTNSILDDQTDTRNIFVNGFLLQVPDEYATVYCPLHVQMLMDHNDTYTVAES